ncbi:MAG: O-antigen ligase family protein [Saprospiraceae bacterium]|nr:O-antigen ligase family protein [Saprospiraceae bacterium]MBK9631342.1 O-antigen ligase family protein [Saprospiraceae bacterium]
MARDQETARGIKMLARGIRSNWVLFASIVFAALAIYAWYVENYIFLLFPVLIIAAIVVFFNPDFLWFFLAFAVPISVNPSDSDFSGLSLSLPAEPVLIFLLALFIYYVISKKDIDTRIFRHPLSSLLYIYLGWMLVTCVTSTDFVVSIKFFLAKLWFIFPAYFLSFYFIKSENRIHQFIFLFSVSLTLVALYNSVNLAGHNFEDKPSQWTMRPFFKDHTVLGAALAMCIPLTLAGFRQSGGDVIKRLFYPAAFIIMTFCLVITFARAAWVSMFSAILLYFIFLLKIRFKYLLTVLLMVVCYLVINLETILRDLEHSEVASSEDLIENLESVTNISSDQSNLERINRWASAFAMWQERPIFGFGPGTYMFEYAPYQLKNNRTEISTNFGDVGNAHSEYLGAMAEGGFPAMVLVFLILIFTFYYALKAFRESNSKTDRIWISAAACGLATYYTHGFLNNFLDTDKAAVLFWFLTSVIVYFDIKNRTIAESGAN